MGANCCCRVQQLVERLKPEKWRLLQLHVNAHGFGMSTYFWPCSLTGYFSKYSQHSSPCQWGPNINTKHKMTRIVFWIHQRKTGLCVFVSVPLPTGVPQCHLCSRESLFIPLLCNILKLPNVLHNSLLQCATPSHTTGSTRQNLAGTSTWITPCLFWYL